MCCVPCASVYPPPPSTHCQRTPLPWRGSFLLPKLSGQAVAWDRLGASVYPPPIRTMPAHTPPRRGRKILRECSTPVTTVTPLPPMAGQAAAGDRFYALTSFTAPSSLPTLVKAAMALSRWARLWAADICTRMRACPLATTG